MKKLIFWSLLLVYSHVNHASTIDLPSIGQGSSGIVSNYEESQLGDSWLRLFRRQAPVSYDPLINDYLDQLMIYLARHSDIANQNLSLVLVKNSSLNAFAVPGGIVGVHTGLFNFAKTEEQLASVLAHELAHLSQRHYARGLEEQKRQKIPTMAALLASLVLLSTSEGDAGAAAITATQALAIDQRLRFSRLFEQEADRIALKTLARAGLNPAAAAEMFENMLSIGRYSQKAPEFLQSHPITESRVADVKNRIKDYPSFNNRPSIDYHLMRARALWLNHNNTRQSIDFFSKEILSLNSHYYGLAIAHLANNDPKSAEQALKPLLTQYPNHPTLVISRSDILHAQGKTNEAVDVIDRLMKTRVNHYPLTIQKAKLLVEQDKVKPAILLMKQLSTSAPNNPYVWYLLAEYQGLAGNILELHIARAEYFLLHARFEDASNQIANGLRLAPKNSAGHNRLLAQQALLIRLKDNIKAASS